jgi:hypothetical protein
VPGLVAGMASGIEHVLVAPQRQRRCRDSDRWARSQIDSWEWSELRFRRRRPGPRASPPQIPRPIPVEPRIPPPWTPKLDPIVEALLHWLENLAPGAAGKVSPTNGRKEPECWLTTSGIPICKA